MQEYIYYCNLNKEKSTKELKEDNTHTHTQKKKKKKKKSSSHQQNNTWKLKKNYVVFLFLSNLDQPNCTIVHPPTIIP